MRENPEGSSTSCLTVRGPLSRRQTDRLPSSGQSSDTSQSPNPFDLNEKLLMKRKGPVRPN